MNIKAMHAALTVATVPLTRAVLMQLDAAHDRNTTREAKPLCRVSTNEGEYVVIQNTPETAVRIMSLHYQNCGWERALGALDTIPKAILK